jgi:hypothetical protein
VHEIKHDGYRLIVRRDGKVVRLFTRRGYDWTDRYPAIAAAAAKLRATSLTLDGEAVVTGADASGHGGELAAWPHGPKPPDWAHSARTFSKPRSRNWAQPVGILHGTCMMPGGFYAFQHLGFPEGRKQSSGS